VDLTWSAPQSHEVLKRERSKGPSGLFLIIAGKRIAGKWNEGTFKLIDIGQSGDIHRSLSDHVREDCWHPHARGSSLLVKVAALPDAQHDETDRRALVCCLRAEELPPCGSECNEGYHREEAVVISNQGKMAPLRPTYSCSHEIPAALPPKS
jgi:hypothetical protein